MFGKSSSKDKVFKEMRKTCDKVKGEPAFAVVLNLSSKDEETEAHPWMFTNQEPHRANYLRMISTIREALDELEKQLNEKGVTEFKKTDVDN